MTRPESGAFSRDQQAERDRDHAPARHPPGTRHHHSPAFTLAVRAMVVTTMSFGIAFGFLSGTLSQGAQYDLNAFAIGVAAFFGAACAPWDS